MLALRDGVLEHVVGCLYFVIWCLVVVSLIYGFDASCLIFGGLLVGVLGWVSCLFAGVVVTYAVYLVVWVFGCGLLVGFAFVD